MWNIKFLQHLVINAALTISIVLGQSCPSRGSAPHNSYAFLKAHDDGNSPNHYFYIGGLFGNHYTGGSGGECGDVRTRGIHNLEAFLWATSTFQDRYPDALKGIRIGAVAFDSCSDSFRLQQQVANFRQRLVGYGEPHIDPDRLLGYVGPDRSSDSMTLASYFSNNGPPMVSHAATSGLLSDKKEYPHFLRTVPSDIVQVEALVTILQKQNWNYVQIVYSGNAYGEAGKDSFMVAANTSGICIVNEQMIPESMNKEAIDDIIASLQQHQQTRAVIVFANEDYSRALLEAADGHQGVRGYFTWVGTTAWSNSGDVVEEFEQIAEGAVTLSLESYPSQDVNTDFTNYFRDMKPQDNKYNPWFKEYWSSVFQCYYTDIPNRNQYNRLCDDSLLTSSLKGTNLDVYVPYTIKAVDTILKAIDKARTEMCDLSSDGLCDDFLNSNTWKAVYDFMIGDDTIFNTTTGDPLEANYEIYNYRTPGARCSKHCYTLVGDYRASDHLLTLETANIHAYNVLGDRVYDVQSICNADPCVICGETTTPGTLSPETTIGVNAAVAEPGPKVFLREETWVLPLLILTSIGVALVVIFDIYLLCKICGSAYMKHWRTMWLGQLLIIGILLSYLTLYAFVIKPTKETCGIIRFGVGVSYAMCFSVLLVKLMILLSSESFGYLKGAFQVLMFVFAWGIQIVVGTEWLVLRYPNVIPSPDNSDIMICQHGDFVSHIQALIYVMVLILICTVMAIRTSRISTNHREGVFIGLCAGFTIPIFIVWTLLGILYNDPAFHDPCLAFGLFATATLMLFVMFLPKVRQLNSMGVEGIYAEDDGTHDSVDNMAHVFTSMSPPSVYSTKSGPPSVIGYATSKTGEGSVIILSNGELGYGEPVTLKPVAAPDTHALHLRHPGTIRVRNMDSVSMHSAPMGNTHISRLPAGHATGHSSTAATQPNNDAIHATTRVLRMTNDLTGRRTPVTNRKAISELDVRPSSRASEPGKPTHTLMDLGSL